MRVYKVFVRSLLSDVGLSGDTVEQMFPRLDQLIAVHRALLRSFVNRQRLRQDRSVDDIGELLVKQVMMMVIFVVMMMMMMMYMVM